MAKKTTGNSNSNSRQAKQLQQLMRMGPIGVIIVVVIFAINYFTGVNLLDLFDQGTGTVETQQTQQVQPVQTAKPNSQPQEGDIIDGTVTRVVDGDTIVVKVANEEKERRVRMLGVDTPETVHPNKDVQYYGPEASAYTKTQLTGKRVWLEYDVAPLDRYQRHLAYVWLKKPGKITEASIRDGMYNAHLLLGGYGRVMTIQPNSRYAKLFATFQAEARNAKRGLWEKEQDEDTTGKKTTKKK